MQPETIFLAPTAHVPNSDLPILIYRNAVDNAEGEQLPSVESVQRHIEHNAWLLGGVFKTYKKHHFHSNTHECYAVIRGSSRLLLGRGPEDDKVLGSEGRCVVDIKARDVIVLPAGVSHCSLTSEGDYEYVGLYPQGSPKWDMNYCEADAEETRQKRETGKVVPVPSCDPILGPAGPLISLWSKFAASA